MEPAASTPDANFLRCKNDKQAVSVVNAVTGWPVPADALPRQEGLVEDSQDWAD